MFWRIVSLGGSEGGESNFGGSPNLSGNMQALFCTTLMTHGLSPAVGTTLMCLCQICAELLLIFYFFTNYWLVGPPVSFFIEFSLLEWNAISSHFIQANLH